jgi:hypothetical protein
VNVLDNWNPTALLFVIATACVSALWGWIRRVDSRLHRHDRKFQRLEDETGINLNIED